MDMSKGSQGVVVAWTAEQTLMVAILEDAIACYRHEVKPKRENPDVLARQAEFWIRSQDWDSPFSFNNVCESLGLESAATRTRVLGQDWAKAA